MTDEPDVLLPDVFVPVLWPHVLPDAMLLDEWLVLDEFVPELLPHELPDEWLVPVFHPESPEDELFE